MKKLQKILLVEDNPQDVELTLAALEEYNIANEVMVVHDGEEALDYLYGRGRHQERADKKNPVLVLLDLKMPKVDGLQVLETIKGDPTLSSIPVVMLTSSREEPDLARAYHLGVNAYVVKPVDFQSFIDAVRHLGVFWAVINEPPPGGADDGRSSTASPFPT